tara:strand:- start:775 stop:951 length:177 start_codon:yes stop_codon:yes gene_type:complete
VHVVSATGNLCPKSSAKQGFSFLKLINSIRGGQVMNVIQNDIELKGRNVNVSQHLQKV